MSVDYEKLGIIEVEKLLIPAIIKYLQENGGEASRREIKDALIANDDDIARFSQITKRSKKTGSEWAPFEYRANFSIKNLAIAGIVDAPRRGNITLTDKGSEINLKNFDIEKEVYLLSNPYWQKRSEENKEKHKNDPSSPTKEEELSTEENLRDKYFAEFKQKLLEAISKMSPKKFEQFSRRLISRMGVEFTEEGTQVSNDGGIDGLGYHRDSNDFRTTRVVIQCKRYNTGDVGSPDIDKFIGAMVKKKADYGIFITNSHFSKAARRAAKEGVPITLINGDELVNLIVEFKLGVTEIKTYELTEYYED